MFEEAGRDLESAIQLLQKLRQAAEEQQGNFQPAEAVHYKDLAEALDQAVGEAGGAWDRVRRAGWAAVLSPPGVKGR